MLNLKARPSITGSWSSERRLPWAARHGMALTGAISIAVHIMLLTLVIWQPRLRDKLAPVEIPAEVELAIGDGAAKNGAPPPASPQTPQPEHATPVTGEMMPKEPGDLGPSATKPSPPTAPPVQHTAARPQTEINLGDGIAAPPAIYENPLAHVDSVPDPGNVAPVYPIDAAMRHEEGEVLVEIDVDANGRVSSVKLLQSSGSASLDRTTLETIKHWHFRPAFHDGVAVPSVKQQIVSYSAH